MSLIGLPIGLYEKAMPLSWSFDKKLTALKAAGYDFMELSIDATPQRLERLEWKQGILKKIRRAIIDTGVQIKSIALSANRSYTLGDDDIAVREKGVQLVKKCIRLASETKVCLIQIAGYDVFEKTSTAETQKLFVDSMQSCARTAEEYGITLAIETMDTEFIDTIEKAAEVIKSIDSPCVRVYADNGNITAMGHDFAEDFRKWKNYVSALHIKDTLPGIVRRVPYGEGTVNLREHLKLIRESGYGGIMVAEMWGDDDPKYINTAKKALDYLKSLT